MSMARKSRMQPLTAEEAEFAAEHCDLIEFHIHTYHLPEEFYGSAAEGLLRATKKWFACPKLHKWKFNTIAKNAMRSTIGAQRRYELTHNPRVVMSLDDPLIGMDGATYIDALPDRAMSIDDQVCIRETLAEVYQHKNPKR